VLAPMSVILLLGLVTIIHVIFAAVYMMFHRKAPFALFRNSFKQCPIHIKVLLAIGEKY